jgi:maltooligosyltrehalose trehalohydrolase
MNGERLERLIPFEAAKLASAILLFGPNIPMLFMGEEYAETSPFLYFVSHNDSDLIEAVREGRKEEFATFDWEGEPPDPQSVDTFLESKLNWDLKTENSHATMYNLYKLLIQLRKEIPALKYPDKEHLQINKIARNRVLTLSRRHDVSEVFGILNFSEGVVNTTIQFPEGSWESILDSSDATWDGPGAVAPEKVEGELSIDIPLYAAILYRRKS